MSIQSPNCFTTEIKASLKSLQKIFDVSVGSACLSDEQQRFLDTAINMVNGKTPFNVITLLAGAGCGKTYVLKQLIKQLVKSGKSVKVVCPTHKALSLYNDTAQFYSTVASHIGMQFSISDAGEPKYTINKAYDGDDGDDGDALTIDVIVLDEVGMVTESNVRLIAGTCKYLILSGDFYQLPPVNDIGFSYYPGSEVMELTKIFRFKSSEQMESSYALRDAIAKKDSKIPDVYCRYSLSRESSISEYVKQHKNGLKPVILAYTNKVVSEFNQRINAELYGDEEFAVGSPILTLSPIIRSVPNVIPNSVWKNASVTDKVVVPQSSFGVVTGKQELKNFVPPINPYGYKFNHETKIVTMVKDMYKTLCRKHNVTGIAVESDLPVTLNIYPAIVMDKINNALKAMLQYANSRKAVPVDLAEYESIVAREFIFDITPYVSDWSYNKDAARDILVALKMVMCRDMVNPAYAMTIHRSQGSTFDTVYVDVADVTKKRGKSYDYDTVMRLLYVATTRAAINSIAIV